MIKRFIADNSRLAMAMVREELGPEAVILSNRRVGDQVELLASADLSAVMAEEQSQSPAAAGDSGQELTMARLEAELVRLRAMLEKELQQRDWRDVAGRPARDSLLRQRLLQQGFSRAVAGVVLKNLDEGLELELQWQSVLERLAQRLSVVSADWQQQAPALVACVGATGVGKSSTVARMAVRDSMQDIQGRVGVLAMDCFGSGRVSPLQQLSRHFDLDFMQAASLSEARFALQSLRDCRRVYIDTAGMSQRDARWSEQLDILLGVASEVSVCCVLSAAAQPAQNREVLQQLGGLKLLGTVVTKVDESIVLGGVLDALIRSATPLLGFSRGQRVPEDFEPADPAELLAQAERQRRAHARKVSNAREPASLAIA